MMSGTRDRRLQKKRSKNHGSLGGTSGSGPRLPNQLTKEIFGNEDGWQQHVGMAKRKKKTRNGLHTEDRGGVQVPAVRSRKEKRKAERKARKGQQQEAILRRVLMKRELDEMKRKNTSGGKRKRHLTGEGDVQDLRHLSKRSSSSTKRQVSKQVGLEESSPSYSDKKPTQLRKHSKGKKKILDRHSKQGNNGDDLEKSRFYELLPGSNDGELQLQRMLAKKLGLKKGKSSMGGDDGLDEILEDLGGIDDLFEDEERYLEEAGDEKVSKKGNGELLYSSKKDTKKLSKNANISVKNDKYSMEEYDSESNDSEYSDELQSMDESELEEGDSMSDDSRAFQEYEDILGSKSEEDEITDSEEKPKHKKLKESITDEIKLETRDEGIPIDEKKTSTVYVPPALRRSKMAATSNIGDTNDTGDFEKERVMRRIRGLLNRLAETNMQGIIEELVGLYQSEGRSFVSKMIASELLSAVAEGPRATEQFAAVTASSIAGIAIAARAADVTAVFLDALASKLDEAVNSGNNLSSGNLILVLAQMHTIGIVRADILFSLLDFWSQRFGDHEVTAIAALLRAAGISLRASDPIRMKEFVINVHERASKETAQDGSKLSVRARVMLDLVVDIKNNKKRGDYKSAYVLSPAVSKWLRSLDLSEVAVGGIPWERILSKVKRGIWWEPNAADAAKAIQNEQRNQGQLINGGSTGLKSQIALDNGENTATELLKLASKMRMNTDTRRAVFCAVMGSEDAIDATEKLLRLGLKGEQEREIIRVSVECALNELSWNPYYSFLLERLCQSSKMHRTTLQYCLWDHWKEMTKCTEIRRLTNLAKLTGTIVALFCTSPSIFKVVDFVSLNPKEVFFWRLVMEALLENCKSDNDIVSIFGRLSTQEQLKSFNSKLRKFLKTSVGPWIAQKDPCDPVHGGSKRLEMLLRRCRSAEKALVASP